MKAKIVAALMLFFMFNTCVFSQSNLADSKPASSNVRGAQYPRVTSDLRAMFQIKAPDARKVQLQLGKISDMVKGDNGIWSITTEPLVPGFHYYFFIIDGVTVSDPASESFFGWGKMSSGIEIPELGATYYTLKNCPSWRRTSEMVLLECNSGLETLFCLLPA
jgi:enterochelin esterase family protein